MSTNTKDMSSDTEKNHVETYSPRSGGDPLSYQAFPTRLANPAPAGLFSFASTTFLLSLYNVHTRGIHTPNTVVGMSFFSGGLIQLLAGLLEIPRGNVFGATVFQLYGGFWLSYGLIFTPSSGIMDSYASDTEFHNALGLYLLVWFMITVMFIFPILRRHVAFSTLLSTLAVAYLLLGVGEITGNSKVSIAGGGFGLAVGAGAFYIGVSEMMAAEPTAFMRLPLGNYSR